MAKHAHNDVESTSATDRHSRSNCEELNKDASFAELATSAVETVGSNLEDLLPQSRPHAETDSIEIEKASPVEALTTEEVDKATDDDRDASAGVFDITGNLFDSDNPNFWSNLIPSAVDGDRGNDLLDMFTIDETEDIGVLESFEETSRTWMEMIQNADGDSISNVIAKAQDMKWQDEEDIEKTSLLELHDAIQKCMTGLASGFQEFFGEDPVPLPSISQLQYYFERTDELKTSSWKRRMHRFFPKIKVSKMEELNEKLQLARLAYASTVEEVSKILSHEFGMELLYCDAKAKPNKPAHFLAIKTPRSNWKDGGIEVFLVVCGTKTTMDLITDLICEEVQFKGNGVAHAGMAEGGQYLAEKHFDLLKRLHDESGTNRIKVHMLGHSLGAGCAA
ncbi:MAG: hypothetical protein SGILL_002508, partial [Bacillariaceae sp.]